MSIERTLAIVKPDAVAAAQTGTVVARSQAEGFRIVALRMARLSREEAPGVLPRPPGAAVLSEPRRLHDLGAGRPPVPRAGGGFLEVADPQGDDHGPGSYTYPGDAVFTSGCYDLVNANFGTEFSDEDFDTVGGLVLKRFGRVPKRGEQLTVDQLSFRVLRADSRRIYLLQVTKNLDKPAV